MPMKNRFGVWIFLLLLLLLLLILGFKMLGHHSWAKNREPYANGMKVGLSASSFLFLFNFLNKIINLFMSDFQGWFGTRFCTNASI
jgi:hypothetical protein